MTAWPQELRGHLDEPADGASVDREAVWIRGWSPAFEPLDRVVVRVDDRRIGLARLGCSRPDLASLSPHPFAPVCGFEFLADVADLPLHSFTVSAEAVGSQGNRWPVGAARLHRSTLRREAAAATDERTSAPVGPSTRLLIVSHGLGYAGAYRFAVDVAVRLAEWSRFDVTVLSLGPAPRGPELRAHGVGVREETFPPINDEAAYARTVHVLAEWVSRGGFGMVLVNSLASFPGADLAWAAGLPCIWAIHESQGPVGFWEVAFPSPPVDPAIVGRARLRLRQAAGAVFAAEATRRLFAEEIRSGPIEVIPYGVEVTDAPDRAAARKSLGLGANEPLIVCLGRVEARKGQSTLVEAIARLKAVHQDVRAALIGVEAPDGYVEAVTEQIRRHRLEGSIHLVPTTPDVHRWLAAADVLACASDVESLPYAVLEAMAAQVLVVSTAVFGVPEVVRDGSTGFLCTPCDIGSLARALDRALTASPEGREATVLRAKATIEERHDPRETTAALADLLHRLYASASGASP